MTMTRKVVWVAVVLVVAFVLLQAFGRADASERIITSRETHNGVTMVTWRDPDPRATCSGQIRGWYFKFRATSPLGVFQYQYGPWSGSFCSSSSHILNVSWGGSPDGSAQWPWQWHPGDTTKAINDTTGDYQQRKWRTHFSSLNGAGRHDYPWLRVILQPGRAPDISSGCGC